MLYVPILFINVNYHSSKINSNKFYPPLLQPKIYINMLICGLICDIDNADFAVRSKPKARNSLIIYQRHK